MHTKEVTWLLVGGGVIGWLLFSAAQPPAPLDPPVATSVAQVQASTANKLAFTNVPGYGLVPTDPTELAKLKAKLKADLDAAFKGTAFFTSHEEAVRAEETGEIAWIYINGHKSLKLAIGHIARVSAEPFPVRILEALEHILKNATDPQMKMTAATLLYRYDRALGKQYLLEVLNAPTANRFTRDVALTLAMNREREAFRGIAQSWPSFGPPSEAMVTTLGRWRDDSVTQFLRQQYKLEPANWVYAMGLSQAGDAAVSETLANKLKSKGGSPTGLTIEAALANLGAIDSASWAGRMQDTFGSRARLGERTLVDSLELAGASASSKAAQALMTASIPLYEEFLTGMELQAKGVREKDSKASNKFPKEPPIEFMTGAAQLLGQWGVKEAVPVLEEVLVTVQKDNRANVYLNEALGLALYRLDPDNWRNTLLNAGVPSYHVERIPGLATLRPLPAEYLPKQVNLKAR